MLGLARVIRCVWKLACHYGGMSFTKPSRLSKLVLALPFRKNDAMRLIFQGRKE